MAISPPRHRNCECQNGDEQGRRVKEHGEKGVLSCSLALFNTPWVHQSDSHLLHVLPGRK